MSRLGDGRRRRPSFRLRCVSSGARRLVCRSVSIPSIHHPASGGRSSRGYAGQVTRRLYRGARLYWPRPATDEVCGGASRSAVCRAGNAVTSTGASRRRARLRQTRLRLPV